MSRPPAPQSPGLPTVAAILTWFLPGLGHLYLGLGRRAAFGFLVIGGSFVAGATLANGASFAMLDPDLRSTAAYCLSPELGNLGGFLWQFGQHAATPQALIPRLFSGPEKLGVLLMALSGLANLLWISAAHWEARRLAAEARGTLSSGPSPALLASINLVLPGLGFALQGRRLRGLAFGGMLIGLYLLGLQLSEGALLERSRHYYYWSAQLLIGLPALIATPFAGPLQHSVPRLDMGVFYAGLAGLLNALTCLDVYGFTATARLGAEENSRAQAVQTGSGGEARGKKYLVGVPTEGAES